MRLSPRDHVVLTYAYLAEGETINGEVCPHCNGGLNGDRTLSVSRRDGSLLWICYRASCPFRGSDGRYDGTPKDRSTVPSARAATGRWIARQADQLPLHIVELLAARYGIDEIATAKAGFGWSEEDSRLVMPVRSYAGEEHGVMLRALDGRTPKVVSYTDKGAIAWYTNRVSNGTIIVEDQLSAVRASAYLTSVALLGTDLSYNKVNEIKDIGRFPVLLALDNDAIAKAVKYVQQYRSVLPMQLVRLDKDIKDMTHEEADALFDSGIPFVSYRRVC